MHTHPRKIMILAGVLILIYAGMSAKTLHAAPLNPAKGVDWMVATQVPVLNMSAPGNTQVDSVPCIISNMQDNGSTPAQQLGDLDAISWSNLAAVNAHPVYAQFLILPPYNEYQPRSVIAEKTDYSVSHNTQAGVSYTDAIDPWHTSLVSKLKQAELGIQCTACHATSNTADSISIIMNHGHLLHLQAPLNSKFECDVCHTHQLERVTRQIRGVE